MLQNNKPILNQGEGWDTLGGIGLADVVTSVAAILRRQFRFMLLVFLVVLALGVTYLASATRRYTATAELIIDTRKSQFLQQQTPLGVDVPLDSPTIDSQAEVLKSENVSRAIIKDLHLTEDPEFVGSKGGIFGALFSLVSSLFPGEPVSEFELTRMALERFSKQLAIKRVGLTYVIEINFESTDPLKAAKIANAVADAYIQDSLEAKYQSSRRAAVWLQERMKDLRAQAAAADRAVVDYKAKNNIVDTGGRLLNEQQLAELNSALIVARAQRAEAQARKERIFSILDADQKNQTVDATATVSDTLHNDVITRLRQQYLDLAARESDWSKRYGATHLATVNLRNQMQEIRRSIYDELRRIGETYNSDFEIARAREDEVQKSLNQIVDQSNNTQQAQVVLRDLDSTAQSYRSIADNFLQLYMVSVQQQSIPITESRLITQASPPSKPSSPKLLLVSALSIFGGGMLAFAAGALREMTDRTFRTGRQIETLLNVDCIAVLPLVSLSPERAKLPLKPRSATGSHQPPLALPSYLIEQPFSRFAESIRSIKIAADMQNISKPGNVIGFTSSLPGEGKTTVVASVGHMIARSGSKVILIDLDLRNPSLTRLMTSAAQFGLTDVAKGQAALSQLIYTDPKTKLDIIPAARGGNPSASTEMMSADVLKRFIDELKNRYDYVLVDLPPLLPVVDVRSTTKIIDSYIFVVEWGKTKTDTVQQALHEARGIYDNLLGAVLNKVNAKTLANYSSYYSYYYGDGSQGVRVS